MNEKNLLAPIPMAAPTPGYHHAIIGILLKATNSCGRIDGERTTRDEKGGRKETTRCCRAYFFRTDHDAQGPSDDRGHGVHDKSRHSPAGRRPCNHPAVCDSF